MSRLWFFILVVCSDLGELSSNLSSLLCAAKVKHGCVSSASGWVTSKVLTTQLTPLTFKRDVKLGCPFFDLFQADMLNIHQPINSGIKVSFDTHI